MNPLYQSTLADAIIQGTRFPETNILDAGPTTPWALIRASGYLRGPTLSGGYETGIYMIDVSDQDILVLAHALNNIFIYDPAYTTSLTLEKLFKKHHFNNRITGPVFSFFGHVSRSPLLKPRGFLYAQIVDQIIGPLFGRSECES